MISLEHYSYIVDICINIWKSITKFGDEEVGLLIFSLRNSATDISKIAYKNVISILDLPDEIILKIFLFLNVKEILSIISTNKRLYNLGYDASIWNAVNLNQYYRTLNSYQLDSILFKCPDISKLNLRGFQLNVSSLEKCNKLTELNLSHCIYISEKQLITLFECIKRLKKVNLSSLDCMTNNVLDLIVKSSQKTLEELDIGYCGLIEGHDIKLDDLTKIMMLDLSGIRLINMAKLPNSLKNINGEKQLNLSFCIINQCPNYFDFLKGVASWKLNSIKIFQESNPWNLSTIINCPLVNTLNLENTIDDILDLTTLSFSNFPSLVYLNISYTNCTEINMARFISNSPNLEILKLNGCRLIENLNVRMLSKLRILECDRLIHLANDFIYQFIDGKTNTHLELLSLLDCEGLSGAVILHLANSRSNLNVRSRHTARALRGKELTCIIL